MKTPSNDKQILFFNELLHCEDIPKAAEAAGYSREYAYDLARNFKEYFLDLVLGRLTLHASKAAGTIIRGMDDRGDIANGKERRVSAQDILDRIGIVKGEKLNIDGEMEHRGVFVIPAKSIETDVPTN